LRTLRATCQQQAEHVVLASLAEALALLASDFDHLLVPRKG
jgi:hypothetical protein